MIVKLLTEHHLEFLSLKGGCRGLSESTLVKMSNCWKSHAAVQITFYFSTKVYAMDVQKTFALSIDYVFSWWIGKNNRPLTNTFI